MNGTGQLHDAQLSAMRKRVQNGEGVKAAAAAVFGSYRKYHYVTTPDERASIYYAPCNVNGQVTLRTVADEELAERFAAVCKAEGVSQARMLRRLIIQKVALSKP